MRTFVAVVLGSLLVVPHAGSRPPTPPGTNLRSCFVQEVRAPFPSEIIVQSLPDGFRPAPYEGLSAEVGDSATTLLSCRLAGKQVQETWSWVAVLPPRPYRSSGVDGYGFLIKAFAERGAPIARPERRCIRHFFEPAQIDVELSDAGEMQVAHSTTEGEWSDEMRTQVAEATEAPQRVRFFAEGSGGVAGFDMITVARRSRAGTGAYVQRGGVPEAGIGSIAVPGYFAGRALTSDDAKVRLEAGGRRSCRLS